MGRRWPVVAVVVALGIGAGTFAAGLVLQLDDPGDWAAGAGGAPPTSPATTAAPPPTTGAAAPAPATAPPGAGAGLPVRFLAVDDRRLVVVERATGEIARAPLDLGPSSPTDPAPLQLGGVALSPGGDLAYVDLVGGAAGSLRRVRVEGEGGPPEDLGSGTAPVPGPDGRALAHLAPSDPDDPEAPATLVVRRPGAPDRRALLPAPSCGGLSWRPDGAEVAVDLCEAGDPTTVVVVDVARGTLRSLVPPEDATWSTPAFAPDGRLAVAQRSDAGAAVVVAEGAGAGRVVVATPDGVRTLDWSAGGHLLVCDGDGVVLGVPAGGAPVRLSTGWTAAAW